MPLITDGVLMTTPKILTIRRKGARFCVHPITGLFQRMRRENDAAHGEAIVMLEDSAETVHEIDEQLDDMAEWQEKPSEQGDFGTPPGRRDHFQYSSTERGEPPPTGAGGSSPEQAT